MRLRLEDGPKRKGFMKKFKPASGGRGVKGPKGARIRTLYNPATGIAKIIRQPLKDDASAEFGLSGPFKGLKKKMKAKKAVRAKKQEIKQEQKLKRVENKQVAKTARQEKRQTRKATRLDKRTATQENKLQRKLGKREVTAENQAAKIRKAQQKNQEEPYEEEAEAAMDPTYDQEESDVYPEGSFDVPGGDPMLSPSDYGQPDTIDVEAEEVTEPSGELSAGWIDGVIKIAKGVAGGAINAVAPNSKVGNALLKLKDTKTGQAVTKIVNSKTGQVVKAAVDSGREVQIAKQQLALLQERNKSLTTQRNVLIGTNVASAGLAVYGFVRKRR
jgi:hypothetical protein